MGKIRLLVMALAGAMALLLGAPAQSQVDTQRRGGDYRVFALGDGGPSICEAACRSDQACRAWTFVRPEANAGNGECQLKSAVSQASPDPCCVSGLATAGFLAGGNSAGDGLTAATQTAPAGAPDGKPMPQPPQLPKPAATDRPIDIKPAAWSEGR